MRLFFCRKSFIKGTVNVALLGVDFPTFGIPRLTDREGKKLPSGFHFIVGRLQLRTYRRNFLVAASHLADFEAISASPRAFHSARFSAGVLALARLTKAPKSSPLSIVGMPVLVSTNPAKIKSPADWYSS